MTSRVTYLQARIFMLVLGIGLSVGQTLLAWERGAAPTEVLAPALYILVFAGAIFWFIPGGFIGAGVASAIYGVLLGEQSRVVGIRLFIGLLLSRIATYVFYALVVGIGTRYMEGRLRKLELHDQIDDVTGLHNSAFFLEDSDLEIGRAKRYGSKFSVIDVVIDREAFSGVRKGNYRRALKDLAASIDTAVRKVDRAVRVDTGDSDRFLVVLPETPPEGAEILTERLQIATRAFLVNRGATANGSVTARAISFPQDEQALIHLREEVFLADNARRAIQPIGTSNA